MTPRDLFTNSFQYVKKNEPDIAYGCIKKLTITIEAEKRNYYVMGSRDVKTEVTIDHFGFEIPRKHLIMLSLGTLQKSISSRNSP